MSMTAGSAGQNSRVSEIRGGKQGSQTTMNRSTANLLLTVAVT